ncbi:MAG: hypothetical protein IRZ02_06350 [Acidothermus sp.]|nr:hypothetical protein [Acidothermus sp.]MCL6537069.1 hypothetical protein [Acidothermus sp.]
MSTKPVPPDASASPEVPEADAAEQHTEAARTADDAAEEAPRIEVSRWEAEAVDPDDERVVVLDDDDYR